MRTTSLNTFGQHGRLLTHLGANWTTNGLAIRVGRIFVALGRTFFCTSIVTGVLAALLHARMLMTILGTRRWTVERDANFVRRNLSTVGWTG